MNLFKKSTAAVALVTLVSSVFTTGVSAYSTSEIEAANTLAQAGIIVDQSANTAAYNLDQNVLRQEIAAVARGVAGLDKLTVYSNVFSDVTETTPNTWAWSSVNALANAGLVAKNPTFRPEANISKAEAVGMVVKAEFGDAYAYDAALGTTWQEQVVAFAVANGVVSNFTNYDTAATRGFVFEAAANAMSSNEDDEMDDIICTLLGTCGTDEEDNTDDTTVTPPVVVTGGDVEVTLNPASPAAANVPYGAASVKLVSFDVTAGSEDAALNTVSVKRLGVGSSTDITSVYLYAGDKRLTNAITINSYDDVANFTNLNVVVKAGSSMTLTVRGDMKASTGTLPTRSNQIAVTTVNDKTVSGIVGNLMTLLDVGSASVDFAYQTVASTTVNVGSTDVELGKFKLTAPSTQEVDVKSITLTNEASSAINASNVVNLKLVTSDGTVVATADGLTTVRGDDLVTFSFANPIRLGKGNNKLFSVRGDLVGGRSGDNVQFKLSNATDLEAIGLTYGFGLGLGTISTTASTVSLKAGKLTLAFNGPSTKDVSKGTNDVELGTYNITTGGSDIEIKGMKVDFVKTTAFTMGAATALTNIRVVDENGTTVLSDSTNITAAIGTQTLTFGDQVITIPANKTKTFKVLANIPTTTTAGAFNVTLTAPSTWTYVKDLVLNKKLDPATSDFSEVVPNTSLAGNPITVVAGGLTVNFGTDVSSTTVVRGAESLSTATLNFLANRGSDIYLRNVKLDLTTANLVGTATAKDIVSSVGLYDGTTLVGTLKAVTGTNGNEVTLDNLNYTVPAGTTKSLTVKVNLTKNGDVFAAAAPLSTLKVAVSSVTAEDSNYNDVTPTLTNVVVDNAPTITVKKSGSMVASRDSSSRTQSILTYGSKDNSVYSYRFDVVDESFQVKDLAFKVTGNTSAVSTLKLYQDGVIVKTQGGAEAIASVDSTTGNASFSNLALDITKATVITVKADLVNLTSGVTTGTSFLITLDNTGINKANGLSSGQEVNLNTVTLATVTASNSMVPKATTILVTSSSVSAAAGNDKEVAKFNVVNSANTTNSDVELTQWEFNIDDSNFATATSNYKLYKAGNAGVTVTGVRAGNVVTFDLSAFADRFISPGSTEYIITANVTPDALSTTTENLQTSFSTAAASTGLSWRDGRDDTKYTRGAANTYIDMGSASTTVSSTRLSY